MSRDRIYTKDHELLGDFAFDEAVARVFPDMIKRSVPGYTTIIPMIGVISEQYSQDNSHLYDLGCSLGASLLAMRHGVKAKNCKVVGIDNAEAMLSQCQTYVDKDSNTVPVELHLGDITQFDYENASVITLNFTLQFIDSDKRQALIQKLYDAMLPGGALILSEKICFEGSEQSLQEQLHWDFKRANGYSELEISQKRSALENVLLPETAQDHIDRLKQAGFTQASQWYQCFNFTSFIAIK
ncbi:MAG: carboxy-S-adenosyl-L-methionine synthase CmoA [Bermanella sp.]